MFDVVFTTDMKPLAFGQRLTQVRKQRQLSQDELGKKIGVHGAVIGRYEREEVTPSVEAALRLAQALDVSLDYLVGATDTLLDSGIMKRVLDIQQLPKEEKAHVFALLDAFLKHSKLQQLL